jgi:hypothetical protein
MMLDEIGDDRWQQRAGEHGPASDRQFFGGFLPNHVGNLFKAFEPEKILFDRFKKAQPGRSRIQAPADAAK